MRTFRKILFWFHLVAGLLAGLSIFVMCFTGAALSFENEIVAWSERDVRRVTPPSADAPRLSLDELRKRVREQYPDFRLSVISVSADPMAAVSFSAGRDASLYVDPYTGELKKAPDKNRVHDFMHFMEDLHRVLAFGGENRSVGKAINGACNLAFCFLALSGLYLWWPRTWSARGLKAVALLNLGASGKARDFNWHNAVGLWCAPILVVLTLTAVPISYRWGSALVYRLVGETPPAQQGPGGFPPASGVEVPRPAEGARPLGFDALLEAVGRIAPDAELVTFRVGGPFGGRAGRNAPRGAGDGVRPERRGGDGEGRPRREMRQEAGAGGAERSAEAAVSVTVKRPGSWPRTATTSLSLDPFTGAVLRNEDFSSQSAGRRLRTWTRFLHTGQALGWGGQLVAGLACLGGCLLVYTGVALSWRRFFFRKAKPAV